MQMEKFNPRTRVISGTFYYNNEKDISTCIFNKTVKDSVAIDDYDIVGIYLEDDFELDPNDIDEIEKYVELSAKQRRDKKR
jgi:hypothetical protein